MLQTFLLEASTFTPDLSMNVGVNKPRVHFDQYCIRPAWSRKTYVQGLEASGLSLPTMFKSSPNVILPRSVGVDLQARGGEVAKIFYAGFARQVKREGFDLEDVLQEVFKKIIVSNQGKSPFDPEKSSFGTFVHRVAQSAFLNYRVREQRYRSRYQVGASGFRENDGYGTWDVAELDHADVDDGFAQRELMLDVHQACSSMPDEDQNVWGMALSGLKVQEIRKKSKGSSAEDVQDMLEDLALAIRGF